MPNKYQQIATLMCDITETHLWNSELISENKLFTDIKLKTRVGSGMATYCKYDAINNIFTITYGKKMIASKFNPNQTKNWMTHREIKSKLYFQGETTLLNVLSHTICHEFAHIIQQMNRWCTKGSIHNNKFYYLLAQLHDSGIAETVRQELHDKFNKHFISAEYYDIPAEKYIEQQHSFCMNDRISFNHKKKMIYGKIIKINKRTLIVNVKSLLRNTQWKVPKSKAVLC